MSVPGPDFSKQQELASKKHKDLQDHEKMFLMRREIDHLRSVIRSQNDGSLQSASRAPDTTSSSMDRAPVLTLFLFVGLIVVAIWRRKQQRSSSISSLLSNHNHHETEVMTFELQDSLAGYEAPSAKHTTAFSMLPQDEEEALTIRI